MSAADRGGQNRVGSNLVGSNRVAFSTFTAGQPLAPMSARPYDLAAVGYLEGEYAAIGTAVSYGTEPAEASFATRIVVRRPANPERFSGVVLVEWLNVSSGQDAAPDWTYLADEITRRGHVWVGVSAQFTGVEGGTGAVQPGSTPTNLQGLKDRGPERYAELHHPGDAWSFGIFSAVAEAMRDTGPDHDAGPLAGLVVQDVIAMGESQAAYALTTYVNEVAPQTRAFDGYLLHSRGVGALFLDDVARPARMDQVIAREPVLLRTDQPWPVMVIQAEGDLLGRINYAPARQPDDAWLRVWEIAGTAHADRFQVGDFEEFLGCPERVNTGQMTFVLRAGLRALVDWVREGVAPPAAEPIRILDATTGEFDLDEVGNVRGGVRTPAVDVPNRILSGYTTAPDASLICQLFGATRDADPEILGRLYDSPEDYQRKYAAATDRLIAAGFLLREDRDEILAEA